MFSILGCGGQSAPVKAGGLYSVDDGEGYFRIAKVLVVEEGGVHMRLYKNKYDSRPRDVDFSSLSLGTIHDADGFGWGHVALTHKAFQAWLPIYIGESVVQRDELDGYQEWKLRGGNYFGDT